MNSVLNVESSVQCMCVLSWNDALHKTFSRPVLLFPFVYKKATKQKHKNKQRTTTTKSVVDFFLKKLEICAHTTLRDSV